MPDHESRFGFEAVEDSTKRVLLVDSNGNRRDLRARLMRERGLRVDCASGAERARAMWAPRKYRYILMDLRDTPRRVKLFWQETLNQDPGQKFSFYVGKPEYLASVPPLVSARPDSEDFGSWDSRIRVAFDRDPSVARWGGGLREACWRIAATRAMRQRLKSGALAEVAVNPRSSFGEAVRLAERLAEQEVGVS